VGIDGQLKLLNARVLCIGAGGLGCPISLYLAAAGVGTIGLADVDVVSPSNLQRQILFDTKSIGEDKVKAAANSLRGLNPDVNVIEHRCVVNSFNVMDLVSEYDFIIDGTDNFPTRYCVNDACVILGKPNIYGSIFRFEGMVSVFAPHLMNPDTNDRAPCYRCLWPEPPDPGTVPSCAEGGVMGVLPGVIGTLQATEVVKLIIGIGRPAIGRLLTYNALDMEFRSFNVKRDPKCPVCGDKPTIFEPIDYEQFCGVPILDPNSTEETRSEVNRVFVEQGKAELKSVSLDDRGLPPNYPFKPDLEIAPRELKLKFDSNEKITLIDCRVTTERDITKLNNDESFPLDQISQRIDELKGRENESIIIYCRIGTRSIQFVKILKQNGFKNVKSLAGGILLWNTDVEKGGVIY
ncbi:MAG TPA: ThiF family adenylyltransferase, partial [Tepidisphaeraceae bacterium]|nr:ThiF family adenylyltransferase [Tepidisphaeraceae bacterium]